MTFVLDEKLFALMLGGHLLSILSGVGGLRRVNRLGSLRLLLHGNVFGFFLGDAYERRLRRLGPYLSLMGRVSLPVL